MSGLVSRRVFVGAAAVVQLGIWLLTRPFVESSGPAALVTWLVLQSFFAAAAVLLALLAYVGARAVRSRRRGPSARRDG